MKIRQFIRRLLLQQKLKISLHELSLQWCILGENSVLYEEAEIYNNLLKKENIVIGKNTHIRGQLLTFGHGGKIEIGDYCYIGRHSYVWSAKNIKIGNRVLIAHNCNLFDNDTHPLDPFERHEQFKEIITRGFPKSINLHEQPIIIENDAWIGANSIILKGVKIGKGAVVAAGSTVTKDVEPYSVVAGNPAKVISILTLKRND